MKKTLLILKQELITTVTRKSFLFLAFGIPVVSALIFWAISQINQSSTATEAVSSFFSGPQQSLPDGYVDTSGLIQTVPEDLIGMFVNYPDEAAARAALERGEIASYYLIPDDYVATGEVVVIRPDFNPLGGMDQSTPFRWMLQLNLLGGNIDLARQVNYPLNLEVKALKPELARDSDNPLSFFIPYAVTMIFYVVIFGSASLLLSSVSKEKESRVIEVLMVSVTPRQLLNGKIIGLGLAGLLQTVIWVGTGYVLMRLSGQTFSLPQTFNIPPSFIIWGLVFFVLGYAVYASLMAGMGALAPNLREASQATIIVSLPLIATMFFITVLIEDPHGAISIVFSLFPLSSPVAMMTRLAGGGVPFWQLLLAAALLAVTAAIILRAVASMFRAQALLSGQPFNVKRYFLALVGRG